MNYEESADLEKEQQAGNAPVSIYSESLQEQKKTTTQWLLSDGMTNDVAMYVVVYKKQVALIKADLAMGSMDWDLV